jgi:hypothetical protein
VNGVGSAAVVVAVVVMLDAVERVSDVFSVEIFVPIARE